MYVYLACNKKNINCDFYTIQLLYPWGGGWGDNLSWFWVRMCGWSPRTQPLSYTRLSEKHDPLIYFLSEKDTPFIYYFLVGSLILISLFLDFTHLLVHLSRPSLTFLTFDFSSETSEQNSTKRDRKQEVNIFYQVCVFRADRKNKMAALASDWLRHFRLLLWNRWTEFNETWQEARSQHPLPSLCFSGRSEKQDGRPGLWLAEPFWLLL